MRGSVKHRVWIWWRRLVGIPDVAVVHGQNLRLGAWGYRGRLYLHRSVAPHMDGISTYSVLTLSDWVEPDGRVRPLWLNVAQGRVESWSVKPVMDAAFGVLGRRIGGPR